MENYILLLVATLEHFELVTTKEAEKLAKELKESTIPATYKEMKVLLEQSLGKAKK